MEELIDVLDNNGNKTGEIKPKSQIKKDGNYHRAISVCIINDEKEILMQKRSQNKKVYPGLWSIFLKGHVQSGETPLDACIREIKEELGILVDINELEYLYTIKEEKTTDNNYIENIFFDTFLLIKNIDMETLNIQKEEVEEIKLEYYKNILNDISNNKLIPNINDYEKIFPILEQTFKTKLYIKNYRS